MHVYKGQGGGGVTGGTAKSASELWSDVDTLKQYDAVLLACEGDEAEADKTPAAKKALYDYVQEIRSEYLRSAPQLSKVAYDSKLHVIHNVLGTHTAVSRVQGGKLKAKREIRVATVFREMPAEFLRMVVVHELAHLREYEHNKAFYKLCEHMLPGYQQLEFDLRVYLTWRDSSRAGVSSRV